MKSLAIHKLVVLIGNISSVQEKEKMTLNIFRLKLHRLGFDFYQVDQKIAIFRPELGVLAIVNVNTRQINYPEQTMPTGAVIQLVHEFLKSQR